MPPRCPVVPPPEGGRPLYAAVQQLGPAVLRLVSFLGRRYRIAALGRRTYQRSDTHSGDCIERFNRDHIEIAGGPARCAGAIAVLQRQSTSRASRDPAIHRNLWSAGDL